VWYLKHGDIGYRAVLLPYKEWDTKPVSIEDAETPGNPPNVRPFQWTSLEVLAAASSTDATPGEFDLLDARSPMERGDYSGAARRTVTAAWAVQVVCCIMVLPARRGGCLLRWQVACTRCVL
jgi:hypothetical protein